MTSLSIGLMASHIQFAHFGRVILKHTPKPLFFLICASIILTLSFIFKTKNVQMFGFLILGSVLVYMVVGRKWIPRE
jgi:CDP-diacylglycerol--serine O-phosphatidyltransferase